MYNVVPTFDDPEQLAQILGFNQVIAACFVPDEDGDYLLAPSTGGEEAPHRAVYFAAPEDASDDWMRETVFEIREGKPMEPYQRWCLEEAKRARATSA